MMEYSERIFTYSDIVEMSIKNFLRFLAVLLIVFLAWQVVYSFRGISSELLQVYENMGQSGLWRSAKFFQGTKFANYIQFLNENIPDDAVVLLPSRELAPKSLATTPIMQFYLSPREIINCTDLTCLETSISGNAVILIVKKFPPITKLSDGEVVMFDDTWGVLLPDGASKERQAIITGFGSWLEIVRAAVLPLIWLLLLMLIGALLVGGFTHNLSWILRLSLGYGLGTMLYSLLVAVVALLGAEITTTLIMVVTGTLLLVALGFYMYTVHTLKSEGEIAVKVANKQVSKRRWNLFWGTGFIILAGLSVVISVGKSYHATDSIMLWGAKGYGIAASGSILQVTAWGTNTVAYPLHIPLMIGSFKIALGETLPASKFLFSGYFLAFMFGVFALLQRLGVRRLFAGMAVMFFMTTPLVFRHGTIAYANLGLTFYLVTALLTAELSLRKSVSKSSKGYLFLSGLLFVGAAWTRPEGLILAWLGIALFLIVQYANKKYWMPVKQSAALIMPLVVYSFYWILIK